MYSRPQRDREYQDKVQGVRGRQCNTCVLSPAFTVQADETFKPRVEWSEMFRSYFERKRVDWLLDGLGKVMDGFGKLSVGLIKVLDILGKVLVGLGKVLDILGKVLDGLGKVLDGLGKV